MVMKIRDHMIPLAILAIAAPSLSEEYCHNMIPPLHLPSVYALVTACASS
jgi:hypothetical protein